MATFFIYYFHHNSFQWKFPWQWYFWPKWGCFHHPVMPGDCKDLAGRQQTSTEPWLDWLDLGVWSLRIWVFVILTSGQGCTTHSDLVHNLGILLDLQVLLKELVMDVTRKGFCTSCNLSWIVIPCTQLLKSLVWTIAVHSIWSYPWNPCGSFSWCNVWQQEQSLGPWRPTLYLCSVNFIGYHLLLSTVQGVGYAL